MEGQVEIFNEFLSHNLNLLQNFLRNNVSREFLSNLVSSLNLEVGDTEEPNAECLNHKNSAKEESLPNRAQDPGTQNSFHFSSEKLKNEKQAKWRKSIKFNCALEYDSVYYNLCKHASKEGSIFEIFELVKQATNATQANLYFVNKENQTLELYSKCLSYSEVKYSESFKESLHISADNALVCYATQNECNIFVPNFSQVLSFPNELQSNVEALKISSVIIIVVVTDSQSIWAVAEFLKFREDSADSIFREEDYQTAIDFLFWGSITAKFCESYQKTCLQRKMNEFLLKSTKSIFQDMMSMDKVIKKIMKFTQKLSRADRASLFLVDHKNNELYARIFDVGVKDEVSCDEETNISEANTSTSGKNQPKEIRFPIGKGIAGNVALTGEVTNISDVYSDARFNKEVDILTGYTTKSLLCMPIYIRGAVIGVVQMVNKIEGHFTKLDEENFELFAIYCGLALYYAKLYDKIYRSEKKYSVIMEVLSYHIKASEKNVAALYKGYPHDYSGLSSIDSYDFYIPFDKDKSYMEFLVLKMMNDILEENFDLETVSRFVLTIKKNYRDVPYHNWSHAFYVTQTMFAIIQSYSEMFELYEKISLMIACICHDLDHRGRNNSFMKDMQSPLAALYSTSIMEHHHFNQAISILQQEAHNIISFFSAEDFKKCLALIKHCIIATDLSLFFKYSLELSKQLNDGFELTDPRHRHLLFAIMMTSADLTASAKPWIFQKLTVQVITEEFYQQGDLEKNKGQVPIRMLDRDFAEDLPKSQVDFISNICIPCYRLLAKVLPKTEPLLNGAENNNEKWRAEIKILEERSAKKKISDVDTEVSDREEKDGCRERPSAPRPRE